MRRIAVIALPLLLLGSCANETERWNRGESVREMIRNQTDDPKPPKEPDEQPGAPTRERIPEPDMIEAGNARHAI